MQTEKIWDTEFELYLYFLFQLYKSMEKNTLVHVGPSGN